MNTKYYYFREGYTNAPVVTVCLVEKDNIVARGIAICSPKDRPCKKEGRRLARSRALKAFYSKEDSQSIARWEADEVLDEFCDIFPNTNFKSEYKPDLTDFEKKILWKK